MEENNNKIDNSQGNTWGGTTDSVDNGGKEVSETTPEESVTGTSGANTWGSASNDSFKEQAESSSNNVNSSWDTSTSNNEWDRTQMVWSGDSSQNKQFQNYNASQPGFTEQNNFGYNQNQGGYGEQSGFGYNQNQGGYGEQSGFGYDNSQNGYGEQSNFGYDNSQGTQGGFGYENSMNTYGTQGGFGYDNNQVGYGYGSNNGYGQDMYGYSQNNFSGNMPSEEKPKKKKGLIIGIIIAVIVIIGGIIGIILFSKKDDGKLPKKLENFKYREEITFQEFLDAYYDGSKRQFEKSASAPNYSKIINKPDTYVNETFEIAGYVTSVEGSLYYLESESDDSEVYYCYNAAGKKNMPAEDDYISVYAIFTEMSEDGVYPCMVVWECEQIEESVATAEPTKETEATEETEETDTATGSIEVPEVPELDDEEQAFVDNLEVSQLYSKDESYLYFYIENKNVDSNVASVYMNIYFFDENEECVGYDYEYIRLATNQPYAFGVATCYDDSYNRHEYASANYYFSDVYIYSYTEDCYFDQVDLEITSYEKYDVEYEITNKMDEPLDLHGYLLYYDADGYVLYYDFIYESDVEGTKTVSESYFGDEEFDSYDVYWVSVSK